MNEYLVSGLLIGGALIVAGYASFAKWLQFRDADSETRILMITRTILAAEEKIRGNKAGVRRLEWVTAVISRMYPDYTKEEIDVLIHSILHDLRQGDEIESGSAAAVHRMWIDSGRAN